MLHSGRALPDDDEGRRRGEGVGVMMNEHMTEAWKHAGE